MIIFNRYKIFSQQTIQNTYQEDGKLIVCKNCFSFTPKIQYNIQCKYLYAITLSLLFQTNFQMNSEKKLKSFSENSVAKKDYLAL